MSVIRKNEVIKKLAALVVAGAGIAPEMVKLRPVTLDDLQYDRIAFVLCAGHVGVDEMLSGNQTRCRLRVSIGLVIRIDPVADAGDAVDYQINDAYEPVHAAIEALADGDAASGIQTIEPADGGPTYESAKYQHTSARAVACDWIVTYIRTTGQTS